MKRAEKNQMLAGQWQDVKDHLKIMVDMINERSTSPIRERPPDPYFAPRKPSQYRGVIGWWEEITDTYRDRLGQLIIDGIEPVSDDTRAIHAGTMTSSESNVVSLQDAHYFMTLAELVSWLVEHPADAA